MKILDAERVLVKCMTNVDGKIQYVPKSVVNYAVRKVNLKIGIEIK
jgi:hypothetical protein